MTTVHLIFNAHLDPIWLWPLSAGIDEALATCRSACDRLDAHPNLVFTRGEAWVYDTVARLDPALFDRISEHVRNGRWDPVGGWWIQPDCTFPSGFAMEKQVEVGMEYFHHALGCRPEVAYNVDSFGHAAFLPGLMRRHGQRYYCMMRPQEHELELPSRLFRWQGEPDGPEVTVFRIAGSYCTGGITREHVLNSLSHLPEGVDHTMCFVGLGDHGGGPTESQIAWCQANLNAIPGVKLEFSSPSRFFRAIEPLISSLPLVQGELQHHAIGCYSVHRGVKTGLRRAEHRLWQLGSVLPEEHGLPDAWRKVLLHQFHDTVGGTCLPSAYAHVEDDLASARSLADNALQAELRRRFLALPEAPVQRMVLWNVSDRTFDDVVEAEPWLEETGPPVRGMALRDANGAVPFQRMEHEALAFGTRVAFRARIEPGAVHVVALNRVDEDETLGEVAIDPGSPWRGLPEPYLALLDDPSDTWSHGLDRYPEEPVDAVRFENWASAESGPVLAAALAEGQIGSSPFHAELRWIAGEPGFRLDLQVDWRERHRLLKLVWPWPGSPESRLDGTMGGTTRRANDGRERPIRDFVLGSGAVVCPDVYAADATSERLRLTLLRSPILAHHLPHSGIAFRRTFADQGAHRFRFRFLASLDVESAEDAAASMHRPPLYADLTRGMPDSSGG